MSDDLRRTHPWPEVEGGHAMIGFSSYDDWKTTPPPDEGNPSLCSRCDAWSEWDGPVCPRCGWGEPDRPEPDRDDAREEEDRL